ncbi:MAG: HPr family phosphocarrier protein [Lachnospiraceae bacterium]|nr:HPr family phosphocarrier protein [Lachnospiraceae bacterium]
MIQKSMTIHLDNGLEARPVAVFVQVASQYESSVFVEVEDKKVNAKSIMGMMSLGLDNGEELTVVADGSDEADAIAHIERFLNGQDE